MTHLRLLLALCAIMLASNLSATTICASGTDCLLTLSQGNSSSGFGTGDFGTVHLTLNTTTDVASVDVTLTSGFTIVGTGFPGSFGFADSLGGGLTIGNFSSALYSGATSDATNDLHFDGFGSSNDAAATTAPHAGNGLNEVSFTLSKGTSLTDVNDLLNLFNPAGGDGPAFFVVDAFNGNTSGPGAGNTGLLSVTGSGDPSGVPEPSTYVGMLTGLGLLGWIARRRRSAAVS